jgi:hypothetical protein
MVNATSMSGEGSGSADRTIGHSLRPCAHPAPSIRALLGDELRVEADDPGWRPTCGDAQTPSMGWVILAGSSRRLMLSVGVLMNDDERCRCSCAGARAASHFALYPRHPGDLPVRRGHSPCPPSASTARSSSRCRLDQGESIKAVAEWLGHTDPAFTLATYTHLMPSSDERTKLAIPRVYGRRPGPTSDGPATAQGSGGEA